MEGVPSVAQRGPNVELDSSRRAPTGGNIEHTVFPVKDRTRIAASNSERVNEERLVDAVEQANSLAVMFDRSLKFEYRQEANIYQVSVIDTVKDEVVRKIPPDEVVRFMESIKDMFGAMLDITA